MSNCLDCGKKLSKNMYKRCRSCAQKGTLNHSWKGGMPSSKCLFCGKTFSYYFSNKTGKFCSSHCHGQFNIKSQKWSNENNPMWKGDSVGYDALHMWVKRNLGRPKKCENCGRTDIRLEWANKSYLYKRTLDDWVSLCSFCHRKKDMTSENWGRGKEKRMSL